MSGLVGRRTARECNGSRHEKVRFEAEGSGVGTVNGLWHEGHDG